MWTELLQSPKDGFSEERAMTPSEPFDPVEYKRNSRAEWSSAAAGWEKCLHVVEGEEGGQRQNAKLVDLAGVRPGASVLDIGGGYGEPSLTAARVVGPQGKVVCTDISPEMLALAAATRGRCEARQRRIHRLRRRKTRARRRELRRSAQ